MHYQDTLSTVTEVNSLDTDLQNFKDLLHKVKEIMDGENIKIYLRQKPSKFKTKICNNKCSFRFI